MANNTTMSDPFASLLTAFKQGDAEPQKQQQQQQPKAAQPLQPLQPQKKLTPTPVITTPVQNNHNNLQSNNDEWDKAFDIFNTPPLAAKQEPAVSDLPVEQERVETPSSPVFGSKPSLGFESYNHSPSPPVVDEVRDMEIVRIMSLGYPIDKAVKYYDRGILYDELLYRSKQHQERSQPSLIDSAWGMFNKGKELVESWSNNENFDPVNRLGTESYDRLTLKGDRVPSRGDRLTPRGDRVPSRGKILSPHSDGLSSHGGDRLSQQFKENVRIEHESSSPLQTPSMVGTPSSIQSPPPSHRESLLDFDIPNNVPQQSTSMSASPVSKNVNPSVNTFESGSVPAQDVLLDFTTDDTKQSTENDQLSQLERISYQDYNTTAQQQYKTGHYDLALESYTKSLNCLPVTHPLRLVAMANMMICQLKTGDYNSAIKLTDSFDDFIPTNLETTIPGSNGKSYKDIWGKIVSRRAESYEHKESYEKALECYLELINRGVTSQAILRGRTRCDKIVNPDKFKTAKKTPTPARTPTPTVTPTANSSAPVQRLKKQNDDLAKEEDLKVKLYDQVQIKINNWKADKPNDIRHLLSTFQDIITWNDNWKPVPTTDLVMPKRVKITYMKAVARIHPDKIPKTLDLESRMIAENVFATLSDAWELFKNDNNLP